MIKEPILPLKYVLLGETAVGKTSLINRLIENKFSESFVSTLVGYYSSKDIFYPKAKRNIKYGIQQAKKSSAQLHYFRKLNLSRNSKNSQILRMDSIVKYL